MSIAAQEITALLKREIAEYDQPTTTVDVGTVTEVGRRHRTRVRPGRRPQFGACGVRVRDAWHRAEPRGGERRSS